ncbi:unnamed protein product [Dovyalis caffra]|uniref:Uncharacterized protein n=1 Tax=Dovyalis caffra TaxID=77055 RepID=A0AAV1QUI6_9ROSI|nr:unnamed protein product [Dovyalis caffra]
MSVEEAIEIGIVYSEYKNTFFESMDLSTVKEIQSMVLNGKYNFSPLILESRPGSLMVHEMEPGITITDLPLDACVVRPTMKDNLVLIALARMLNTYFLSSSCFMKECLALDQSHIEFYSKLLCWGKVDKLYYLNLYDSISSLSRILLLRKINYIVKGIRELVSSLIELPIIDYNGIDRSSSIGIPPLAYITDVLVNFLLDNFDSLSAHPNAYYVRSLYSCFIAYPLFSPLGSLLDGDLIECYLLELDLSGKVDLLLPEGEPLSLKEGLVKVNRVGEICIAQHPIKIR